MTHSAQLLQGFEKLILEFSSLVMVLFPWIAKPRDEVIKQLLRSCLPGLVSGGIGLGIPGEVVYDDQDVLEPPAPLLVSRWR